MRNGIISQQKQTIVHSKAGNNCVVTCGSDMLIVNAKLNFKKFFIEDIWIHIQIILWLRTNMRLEGCI